MHDEERREPPERVRVTRLQEAQLPELARIERLVAEMHRDAGIDGIVARGEADLARLTRTDDVYVAEADHQPAGFLSWADHAPGIAFLRALMVAPELHRYGIGSRLLHELCQVAVTHQLAAIVTPVWGKAVWAEAFYAARGFTLIDGTASLPEKLATWFEQHAADAALPGQRLWWANPEALDTMNGDPRA